MRRALLLVLALAMLGGGVAWWLSAAAQPVTVDSIGDENQTVTRGKLPVFAAKGDAAQLYTFAVEKGDTLSMIPCTCGCERFGHTSNRACYVKAERGDQVTFTSHAAT
jgi:Protein of unknown function with PCYCGC motif